MRCQLFKRLGKRCSVSLLRIHLRSVHGAICFGDSGNHCDSGCNVCRGHPIVKLGPACRACSVYVIGLMYIYIYIYGGYMDGCKDRGIYSVYDIR